MVDALDSKSGISNGVRVQVPSPVNTTGQVIRPVFFLALWQFIWYILDRPSNWFRAGRKI